MNSKKYNESVSIADALVAEGLWTNRQVEPLLAYIAASELELTNGTTADDLSASLSFLSKKGSAGNMHVLPEGLHQIIEKRCR